LRHKKIHLFYLEDENKQYLTFEKIYIEGKGNKNSTTVINNMTIDKPAAKSIMEEFANKRNRIEVI